MSSAGSTTETLTGSIERVTFHNPDNGFAVLRLKVRGRVDLVTLIGHLASTRVGWLLLILLQVASVYFSAALSGRDSAPR